MQQIQSPLVSTSSTQLSDSVAKDSKDNKTTNVGTRSISTLNTESNPTLKKFDFYEKVIYVSMAICATILFLVDSPILGALVIAVLLYLLITGYLERNRITTTAIASI